MLFSEEEVSDLFYCRRIAELLNAAYPNKTREIVTSNGRRLKFDYISIFNQLKKIIYRIEVFLVSVFGNDINDENVRFVRDYFDSIIIISSHVAGGEINTHLYLKDFIWGFYKHVSDFFEKNLLFRDIKKNDVLFEMDSIVNELHNLNQSFGLNNSVNNDRLYDRVVLLEGEIKRLKDEVNLNSTQISSTVNGFVLTQEKDLKKQVNAVVEDLKSSLVNIHTTYEEEVKGKVESLGNLVNQTDQDFKSTYDDYQILKKMVQAKGEQLVTDHYKKKALWERITYWVMTIGTFGIIIWSICLALQGLDEYKAKTNISISTMIQQYKDQPVEKIEKIYSVTQNNALTYLVLRLIFSVLLFSSIIYTSRVAYRAYVHMRHSENMMLKLATLRPFINQLKEDERNQIHKDLVPDYFGKDAGLVDSTNEKFKDLPANVSAVAMKAIEQISGSSNSSGTEKNGKKPEDGTG